MSFYINGRTDRLKLGYLCKKDIALGEKLNKIRLKDILFLEESFNFKKFKKDLTFRLTKLKDGGTQVYVYFANILIAVFIFFAGRNSNITKDQINSFFEQNEIRIERVLDISNGGDGNLTPWSPGVRFKGENSRSKNNLNKGSTSNSSATSIQNGGISNNNGSKKAALANYPFKTKGSGLKVNSITITDEDGNSRVVYMDPEKQEAILEEAKGETENSTEVSNPDSTPIFVESKAFSPTVYGSRPAAANKLANELKDEKVNSSTTRTGLSTALNANKKHSQTSNTVSFTTSDGDSPKLSEKSESHLITKHGLEMGINDPLPMNPNQKPTKYESQKVRTRVNKQNREIARDTIQKLLLSEDTEIFDNIQIRGILGKAYYSPANKLVVGIHKEGELKDQIVKTQPLSSAQLEKLYNLNILD